MAQINNKEVMLKLAETANIQIAKESIPNQLAEKIVPTFECNPHLLKTANIVREIPIISPAVSATIYTTPLDKDFYLTSATLSLIKDVNATSISTEVRVTIEGQSRKILTIAGLSLTPQTAEKEISFSKPIKIDRGTNIYVTHSTNVATASASACITGFTMELT
jgi:hypothetical protein